MAYLLDGKCGLIGQSHADGKETEELEYRLRSFQFKNAIFCYLC